MPTNDDNDLPASITLPVLTAADVQDHLMTATNDLDRLQSLLAHACDTLMATFSSATDDLRTLKAKDAIDPDALEDAIRQLGVAVTALQFQDMASQLINHTHIRLRSCADRLARDAFAGDEDGDAVVQDEPLRPNPVTQSEVDAGSIELF